MKNIFRFRSIRAKMLFGFSLVLLLVVVLSVYNYFVINETNQDTKYLANEEIPLLLINEQLAFNASQQMGAIRGYVLFSNDDYIEQFNNYTAENIALKEMIDGLSHSEKELELVEKSLVWSTYIEEEVIEKFQAGNRAGAQISLNEGEALAQEIMDGLNNLALERAAAFDQTSEDIVSSGEMTLIVGIGLSVLAIIIGLVTAMVTSNSIANPINTVMERMNLMASGDLSHQPLEVSLVDETGQLVQATNEMAVRMHGLLMQIKDVSETVNQQSNTMTQSAQEVSAGSDQIASTMHDLAAGSEVQANQTSHLSNIMGVFDTKIREANQNGQHAQNYSSEVLKITTVGYELMNESTDQMNRVNEIVTGSVANVQNLNIQSQRVSELVAVIQEIAEQTNLLALNAAIEAARAGEHGHGFAVVADEVRSLAEGVSESVTDITTIVAGIQNETERVTESLQSGYEVVETGTAQIIETGETFAEISSAIENMVDNIEIVTNNLTDIAEESEQMNHSIEEISATFEQSAAGIEETSAAAEQTDHSMDDITENSQELARLADELNELLQQFKI